MKKISIIIPVFNGENCLKKSVDSCLAQSMIDEIEIIIVDDCSTDNSRSLIENYKNRFPNIIRVLYLPQNGRQGAARNQGIKVATGEYLAFVDADDWIEPDMCEVLYKEAKVHDADMAGCDMYRNFNDKETIYKNCYSTTMLGEQNTTAVGIYTYHCGLFGSRIYRRSMIVNNDIKFLEGVSYEDSYFNYMTALYANKVVKVEKAFYHYIYNPDSTTAKRNDIRQYTRLVVIEKTYEECKRRGLYERYKEEIDFKFIYMLATSVRLFLQQFDQPEVSRFIKISELLKKNTPRYRKNKYYHFLSWKQRFVLHWLVLFPSSIPVLGKMVIG